MPLSMPASTWSPSASSVPLTTCVVSAPSLTSGALLVAKIETRAAVDNLPGIIEASGAVMVARGDLGNECSLEDLHTCKRTSSASASPAAARDHRDPDARVDGHEPRTDPREASDVANAVFDGSSAVMLSGETAVGPTRRTWFAR